MKATTAQTPATLAQKAIALLMALVLCMGLTPHAAWAEETGETGDSSASQVAEQPTVTLTIVKGIDYYGPKVLVNKAYAFTEGQTLADLFAAAKDAGDIEDYEFKDSGYGSYLQSVTMADGTVVANAADWSASWSNFKNGAYASGTACQAGDKLAAGDAFQFAWADSVANYAPSSTQWSSLKDKAEYAVGATAETSNATLTIVKGIDYYGPKVLVNKAYAFTEGQTLADLFAAAKDAGDIEDYEFKDSGYGSYLQSVTMADGTVVANAADWSASWSNFKNGAYASGTACQAGDKLAAGDAFQFAWADSVANYAPTKDQWDALKAKAEGADPAPIPKPEPTPEPAVINKYDAAKAETLIANLSARFASSGKDHAIGNNTFYAAIALNSLGKGASIDADAILANLNKDDGMTAGRMGKYIMALTAAGIDCTKVNDNGTVRNLVAEMEALEKPETTSVYHAVCILPVYQYGSYKQGDSAMAPSALIDIILASADGDGLFGGDTQTTAQAILALLPYQSVRSDVEAAIKKAESALLSMENEDGSFTYAVQYDGEKLDATANIIAALEALGYDCSSDSRLTTSNGSTPLGYLTSVADENLAGYMDASNYDESATSAVVLMAFAAHEGARQADGAYSVYTLKPVTKEIEGANPNPNPDPETKSDAKPLAQTGDDAATAAAAAIALCALASGAVAVRRTRRSRTLV
ncbi:hypothetical protein [uncultured Senegalimassilia sp.]|uniref:hypothetical protein n=1 Tax=uncultured Senegalimassilia sp. TaxID=1714350 RepID=UPI0027DE7BCC|nr:hypothetical protein [uncultured Senegalimassilia sp.]